MSDDSQKEKDDSLDHKVQRVQRVTNPNRVTVYANSAIVIANQWDIQVTFGLMHETSPGKLEVVDQALVVMNPEHALAFSKALNRTVASYEKTNGKIREIKPVEPPTT